MTRFRADVLLFVTAVIWGTVFIAQKAANHLMGPITFVGARFLLSALTILPLALYEARRRSQTLTKRDIGLAAMIGVLLVIASSLQQTALLTTTVSNGGFLTALYVVLVPVTTWLLTRERVRGSVMVAGLISVIGAWLLSTHGRAATIAHGDVLIVISDVAWALWISLIAIFLKRTQRPFFLSLMQFSVTAVLGLSIGSSVEPWTWDGMRAAIPMLLYTGVVSGGIAFTLQVVAQRYTPAPEAAVIMSLESVVAVIAGATVLGERLTPVAIAGCALILTGVLIAEIGPALRRS